MTPGVTPSEWGQDMSLSKTSAGESALRARVFVPLIATLVLLGLGLALPVSALALRASGAAGWQAQNASSAGSQAGLNDVTFVDASHGWAVGQSIPAPGDWAPLILATGDGGATWHAQDASSAGSNAALISVSFVDVNHGWALGNNPGSDNSPILATTDGGAIWNAVNTGDAGSTARLSSISFVDAEHGWAVGSSYDDVSGTLSPLVLATSDGGATWHAQNADAAGGGDAELSSITFADADHGWAVGQSSSASGAQSVIILATTNGGVIWKAENAGSAGSNAGLSDVAFSDATHGWAVGSSYNP